MHDYTTFKSCQHFKEWGESYLQIKLKTLESLHRSQSICIETENQWLVNITHISYIYIYIYMYLHRWISMRMAEMKWSPMASVNICKTF